MEKEKKVTLKLLVDTEGKKVLFAEASKDFVDFLFHMMSLPVGSIVKLLNFRGMAGCLDDLYRSITWLSGDYMQEGVSRYEVLNPKPAVSIPLLSINDNHSSLLKTKEFYRCSGHVCSHSYIAIDPSTRCPSCCHKMKYPVEFVGSNSSVSTTSSNAKGYVKGVVSYMVMDNLEVKPMSTISAITVLNKFHVKNVTSLVEKNVQVGLSEGVAILKASLETKAVLTSVFF